MKIKPYTSEDLMRIAGGGERFEVVRILATYASPANWRKGIDEKTKSCTWIWCGPVICAFELASWGIVESIKREAKK